MAIDHREHTMQFFLIIENPNSDDASVREDRVIRLNELLCIVLRRRTLDTSKIPIVLSHTVVHAQSKIETMRDDFPRLAKYRKDFGLLHPSNNLDLDCERRRRVVAPSV